MPIPGVQFAEAAVDAELIATLSTDHMERYRVVPDTVMINQWRDDLNWIMIDSTYPSQIRRRCVLLTDHDDMVVGRLPGDDVRAAEKELRNAVVDFILGTYPNYFKRHGDFVLSKLTGITVDVGPDGADPLFAIALLASEDLLLMLPEVQNADGRVAYRLKAGALLFPNNWSLQSRFHAPRPNLEDATALEQWKMARQTSLDAARLGKSPYEIHNGHVSHYMNHFAQRVDRFFSQMRPGMATWRRNWSIKMTPELFLHSDAPLKDLPLPTATNWADHGYLRSEQQTFRKLPESGAVVFSIKTFLWKLSEIIKCPIALDALILANDRLPPAMADYRTAYLLSFREFLDRHR